MVSEKFPDRARRAPFRDDDLEIRSEFKPDGRESSPAMTKQVLPEPIRPWHEVPAARGRPTQQ